jgi:hypothetical protein
MEIVTEFVMDFGFGCLEEGVELVIEGLDFLGFGYGLGSDMGLEGTDKIFVSLIFGLGLLK